MKINNSSKTVQSETDETFRPPLIKAPTKFFEHISYALRLCIDTPHRSLISNVQHYSAEMKGAVLDVGAGTGFYKRLLPHSINYVGLEINETKKYFKNENPDLIFYDGRVIPFEDNTYDNVLCFEVMEHVYDYNNLLSEIFRVLKPGGTLLLSVPFAAKYHFVPFDFFRYTPAALKLIFERNGFEIDEIRRRGGDVAVLFHQIIVVILGLFFSTSFLKKCFGFILLPLGIVSGFLANISEYFDLGAPENTLGYFLVCKRPSV